MPRTFEDELVAMRILFISGLSIVDNIGAWFAFFGVQSCLVNILFSAREWYSEVPRNALHATWLVHLTCKLYMVYAGKIIDLHVLGLILASTRVPGVDFKSTVFC